MFRTAAQAFNAACDHFVETRDPATWPAHLRVNPVANAPGIFDMTWSFGVLTAEQHGSGRMSSTLTGVRGRQCAGAGLEATRYSAIPELRAAARRLGERARRLVLGERSYASLSQ